MAEQLVRLVQDQHLAVSHVGNLNKFKYFYFLYSLYSLKTLFRVFAFVNFINCFRVYLLLHQIQNPAGGSDDEMNLLVDPHDIVLQIGAACE